MRVQDPASVYRAIQPEDRQLTRSDPRPGPPRRPTTRRPRAAAPAAGRSPSNSTAQQATPSAPRSTTRQRSYSDPSSRHGCERRSRSSTATKGARRQPGAQSARHRDPTDPTHANRSGLSRCWIGLTENLHQTKIGSCVHLPGDPFNRMPENGSDVSQRLRRSPVERRRGGPRRGPSRGTSPRARQSSESTIGA